MSKWYMFLTFLSLPYFILRAKFLLKKDDEAATQKELKRYGDDFFKIRKKKIVTHGEENYVDLENAIFISNHQSHNDIFILLSCLKKPFRFIAKKELFESVIFKDFMKLSKSYPLDRQDDRASLMVLKDAIKDIKDDKASVVVFPEGTRSHSAFMNPFKSGLFSMLKRAQTPFIPVYIHESYKNDTNLYHVYFGQAIEDFKMKGPELSQKAFESIQALQFLANKNDA